MEWRLPCLKIISGKIFMEIQSEVTILLGIVGLQSIDDLQNLMDCSLYHPTTLQSTSSKSINPLSSKLLLLLLPAKCQASSE